MEPFTIEETLVTAELTNKSDEGFRLHGKEETGFDEPTHRIAFTANAGNTFAGCVTAHVIWRTVHIRHMFIASPYRRMRLGSLLIEKALNFGKAHGCTVAFVDTLSFQAIEFYLNLQEVYQHNL